MKRANKRLDQYLFENHNFDGTVDDFFEETASSIGSIVHCFNSLEAELNSTICQLINDRSDETGAIIIYKQPFSSKIDLFYRLVRSLEIGCNCSIPGFQVLIENLKKSSELRNAVIHAEWDTFDDHGYTYVKMHFDKNGMTQQYWQFTPESLEEIDEFIHNTYLLLDAFEEETNKLLCR